MNVKRTTAIVLSAAALAAWFAGAATTTRVARAPLVVMPPPVDVQGAELAKEIARLHERLRPTVPPAQPGRNVFAFRSRPAPIVAAPPPVTAAQLPPPAPAPPRFAFKLLGIAEDETADGAVRTAILSGDGQVVMVKEGESIAGRYLVTKITADVVEITDTNDDSTRRLALR
jgi:hypothetical protein